MKKVIITLIFIISNGLSWADVLVENCFDGGFTMLCNGEEVGKITWNIDSYCPEQCNIGEIYINEGFRGKKLSIEFYRRAVGNCTTISSLHVKDNFAAWQKAMCTLNDPLAAVSHTPEGIVLQKLGYEPIECKPYKKHTTIIYKKSETTVSTSAQLGHNLFEPPKASTNCINGPSLSKPIDAPIDLPEVSVSAESIASESMTPPRAPLSNLTTKPSGSFVSVMNHLSQEPVIKFGGKVLLYGGNAIEFGTAGCQAHQFMSNEREKLIASGTPSVIAYGTEAFGTGYLTLGYYLTNSVTTVFSVPFGWAWHKDFRPKEHANMMQAAPGNLNFWELILSQEEPNYDDYWQNHLMMEKCMSPSKIPNYNPGSSCEYRIESCGAGIVPTEEALQKAQLELFKNMTCSPGSF